MSTVNVPSMPVQRRPSVSIWKRILVVVGVLAITFFVGSVFLSIFGLVSGQEFSPQSFTTREFYYYQVPGTTWRLSATYVSSLGGHPICSSDILKYITTAADNPRWDLISYRVGSGAEVRDEAAILTYYLQSSVWSKDAPWVRWSNDHPTLAAELWPAIHQLAIHHGYSCIPELMEFAWSTPPVAELKHRIREIAHRFALERIPYLLEMKLQHEASDLLDWAKTFGENADLDNLKHLLAK